MLYVRENIHEVKKIIFHLRTSNLKPMVFSGEGYYNSIIKASYSGDNNSLLVQTWDNDSKFILFINYKGKDKTSIYHYKKGFINSEKEFILPSSDWKVTEDIFSEEIDEKLKEELIFSINHFF